MDSRAPRGPAVVEGKEIWVMKYDDKMDYVWAALSTIVILWSVIFTLAFIGAV